MGTNWEMRATLPELLCFCLCKEEEIFVQPISWNDLTLTAGGPAKPPVCAHAVQGSPVATLLSIIFFKKGYIKVLIV